MVSRLLVSSLIALALALTATGASAQQRAAVQSGDNFFAPQTITVAAGSTVVWSNIGSNPHTVTANNRSFDSGILQPGQTFSMTFNTAGSVGYFCQIHGAPGTGQFGTVTVTAAAAAPVAPAPAAKPAAPGAPAAAAPAAAQAAGVAAAAQARAPAQTGGPDPATLALVAGGLGAALTALALRLRSR